MLTVAGAMTAMTAIVVNHLLKSQESAANQMYCNIKKVGHLSQNGVTE